mgnify:CR=1 FL=1
MVEGVAANANAAALGFVEFNADFGDAAISATGEVLAADDAARFQFSECLIEAVAIGLAGPGGFDGALFGPEAFEFHRGVGAERVRIGARHSAYVKVAEGCDRPCAFCIIPKLRGPQRSRSIADIVAEVRGLAAEGVVEINLIAQDLTRYGWDLGATPQARPSLAQLLGALGQVDGIAWIRLHYTFPSAFDDELIDAIAREPKVVKYIDVPLQHINDAMLKRMRRGHTGRLTRELVAKLRARIDGVVLRSTFIVGHPGETEAEFAELYDFVGEAKLERAGAFPFSIEPGTVSAILPNRVPAEVAAERQQRLMELQRQISLAKHEAMVGQVLEVLVEGVSAETELLLEGRWYGQAPGIDGVTYLADGQAAPGARVRARVTQASDYDLAATLDRRAAPQSVEVAELDRQLPPVFIFQVNRLFGRSVMFSQFRMTGVDGNSINPGRKLGIATKLPQIAKRRQERFLANVACVFVAPQHAQRQPVNRSFPSSHQNAESICFTGESPLDDLIVADVHILNQIRLPLVASFSQAVRTLCLTAYQLTFTGNLQRIAATKTTAGE